MKIGLKDKILGSMVIGLLILLSVPVSMFLFLGVIKFWSVSGEWISNFYFNKQA
jgi:hypothetical protein